MDKINYEDGLQFALAVIRRRFLSLYSGADINSELQYSTNLQKVYKEVAAELADVQVQPERDLNQLAKEIK